MIKFVRDADGTPWKIIANNNENIKYGANWTTFNITKLIYSCDNGPSGSWESVQPLQMSGNYHTYQQLIAAGWPLGLYDCTITGTGPGGTTSVKDTFRIQ